MLTLFSSKFLTLLAFIILNFLILFVVKTRTTTITSLIIAHLIIVLFFSLSISSYNSFKEIVLALIVYSTVILFLISNYNPVYLANVKVSEIKASRWFVFLEFLKKSGIFFAALLIFSMIFLLAKNVDVIAKFVEDKKLANQEEVLKNPMISPSHPVHIAIKTFYLGKTYKEEWDDKISEQFEINERKKARLRDKLSDNFLLKRSSDVILIIVAITTSMLLLTPKKNENS
jgi:hypothetical protein